MSLYQVTFKRFNRNRSSIKSGEAVHTQPAELEHTVNVNAVDEDDALLVAKKMTQGLIFDRELAPSAVLLKEPRTPAISVEWHDATGQHCSFCESVCQIGHIAEVQSNLPFPLFICSECVEDLKKRLS